MTFPRLDVGPAQPGVVQRGRHQGPVTPGVREAHKIAPRADAAPREQLDLGMRLSERSQEREIEAETRADPGEIDHEDRARARIDGGPHELERRSAVRRTGKHDGLAATEIEAEDDPPPADRGRDVTQRIEGGQRLEPDDDTFGAVRQHVMRPPRSRHRRIHQQPAAGHGEGIEQRLLRRAAGDGIEIGDIPLVAAQPLALAGAFRDRSSGNSTECTGA